MEVAQMTQTSFVSRDAAAGRPQQPPLHLQLQQQHTHRRPLKQQQQQRHQLQEPQQPAEEQRGRRRGGRRGAFLAGQSNKPREAKQLQRVPRRMLQQQQPHQQHSLFVCCCKKHRSSPACCKDSHRDGSDCSSIYAGSVDRPRSRGCSTSSVAKQSRSSSRSCSTSRLSSRSSTSPRNDGNSSPRRSGRGGSRRGSRNSNSAGNCERDRNSSSGRRAAADDLTGCAVACEGSDAWTGCCRCCQTPAAAAAWAASPRTRSRVRQWLQQRQKTQQQHPPEEQLQLHQPNTDRLKRLHGAARERRQQQQEDEQPQQRQERQGQTEQQDGEVQTQQHAWRRNIGLTDPPAFLLPEVACGASSASPIRLPRARSGVYRHPTAAKQAAASSPGSSRCSSPAAAASETAAAAAARQAAGAAEAQPVGETAASLSDGCSTALSGSRDDTDGCRTSSSADRSRSNSTTVDAADLPASCRAGTSSSSSRFVGDIISSNVLGSQKGSGSQSVLRQSSNSSGSNCAEETRLPICHSSTHLSRISSRRTCSSNSVFHSCNMGSSRTATSSTRSVSGLASSSNSRAQDSDGGNRSFAAAAAEGREGGQEEAYGSCSCRTAARQGECWNSKPSSSTWGKRAEVLAARGIVRWGILLTLLCFFFCFERLVPPSASPRGLQHGQQASSSVVLLSSIAVAATPRGMAGMAPQQQLKVGPAQVLLPARSSKKAAIAAAEDSSSSPEDRAAATLSLPVRTLLRVETSSSSEEALLDACFTWSVQHPELLSLLDSGCLPSQSAAACALAPAAAAATRGGGGGRRDGGPMIARSVGGAGGMLKHGCVSTVLVEAAASASSAAAPLLLTPRMRSWIFVSSSPAPARKEAGSRPAAAAPVGSGGSFWPQQQPPYRGDQTQQTLRVQAVVAPIVRLSFRTRDRRLAVGQLADVGVEAYDAEDNVFTSLEGLLFVWRIEEGEQQVLQPEEITSDVAAATPTRRLLERRVRTFEKKRQQQKQRQQQRSSWTARSPSDDAEANAAAAAAASHDHRAAGKGEAGGEEDPGGADSGETEAIAEEDEEERRRGRAEKQEEGERRRTGAKVLLGSDVLLVRGVHTGRATVVVALAGPEGKEVAPASVSFTVHELVVLLPTFQMLPPAAVYQYALLRLTDDSTQQQQQLRLQRQLLLLPEGGGEPEEEEEQQADWCDGEEVFSAAERLGDAAADGRCREGSRAGGDGKRRQEREGRAFGLARATPSVTSGGAAAGGDRAAVYVHLPSPHWEFSAFDAAVYDASSKLLLAGAAAGGSATAAAADRRDGRQRVAGATAAAAGGRGGGAAADGAGAAETGFSAAAEAGSAATDAFGAAATGDGDFGGGGGAAAAAARPSVLVAVDKRTGLLRVSSASTAAAPAAHAATEAGGREATPQRAATIAAGERDAASETVLEGAAVVVARDARTGDEQRADVRVLLPAALHLAAADVAQELDWQPLWQQLVQQTLHEYDALYSDSPQQQQQSPAVAARGDDTTAAAGTDRATAEKEVLFEQLLLQRLNSQLWDVTALHNNSPQPTQQLLLRSLSDEAAAAAAAAGRGGGKGGGAAAPMWREEGRGGEAPADPMPVPHGAGPRTAGAAAAHMHYLVRGRVYLWRVDLMAAGTPRALLLQQDAAGRRSRREKKTHEQQQEEEEDEARPLVRMTTPRNAAFHWSCSSSSPDGATAAAADPFGACGLERRGLGQQPVIFLRAKRRGGGRLTASLLHIGSPSSGDSSDSSSDGSTAVARAFYWKPAAPLAASLRIQVVDPVALLFFPGPPAAAATGVLPLLQQQQQAQEADSDEQRQHVWMPEKPLLLPPFHSFVLEPWGGSGVYTLTTTDTHLVRIVALPPAREAPALSSSSLLRPLQQQLQEENVAFLRQRQERGAGTTRRRQRVLLQPRQRFRIETLALPPPPPTLLRRREEEEEEALGSVAPRQQQPPSGSLMRGSQATRWSSPSLSLLLFKSLKCTSAATCCSNSSQDARCSQPRTPEKEKKKMKTKKRKALKKRLRQRPRTRRCRPRCRCPPTCVSGCCSEAAALARAAAEMRLQQQKEEEEGAD